MTQKLFLIYHGRFPSEKAAALFAARSAESFSKLGYEVAILVPKRKEPRVSSQTFFDTNDSFSVVKLPILDLFNSITPRRLSFWVNYITFSISVSRYLKTHGTPDSIIYSNEILPLWSASYKAKNTFYEMHDFPESKLWLFRRMIRRFSGVIVHNRWKEERLLAIFSLPQQRLLLERNAVNVDEFHTNTSRESARDLLALSIEQILVVYTGHLYGWKGVATLAEAARLLPRNFLVCFVGGTKEDVDSFRARYDDIDTIRIVGYRPHGEIPVWQAAADLLILPNTATEPISALYTSPMKLFEYMASERPIIASDLPSIREIAGDEEVWYVNPDDPIALAKRIQEVVTVPVQAAERARQALAHVMDHTWDKRAQRIRIFIEEKTREH